MTVARSVFTVRDNWEAGALVALSPKLCRTKHYLWTRKKTHFFVGSGGAQSGLVAWLASESERVGCPVPGALLGTDGSVAL